MNAITQLNIINFRCFEDHIVNLTNPVSLIVGKNNAGKSTLIEAIKIISFAIQKAQSKSFTDSKNYFDLPLTYRGLELNLDDIGIEQQNLFFYYDTPPPSKIIAIFGNGAKVEVFIGNNKNFAIFWKNKTEIIKNKKDVTTFLPCIEVMPQPGPLLLEETLRNVDYVKKNVASRRSILHFRNQLSVFSKEFEVFKSMVPKTWKHLSINDLIVPRITSRDIPLGLLISEGSFTAEVAWMGHGVQVWLQTVWFLCRMSPHAILILDEPDVYLHADLQRKLIRMLLEKTERQVIIATHSAEMLAEVKANSVIILNRHEKISQKATSNNAIQAILDNVGSIHNLSLMRIGICRKVLFIEGEDIPLLKNFQDALRSPSNHPIDTIPNTSVGGWTGWPAVKTIAEFFNKNTESNIKVFCIFDRDYHNEDEIRKRKEEAQKLNICIHIWNKKEIESYLVIPSVIARVIAKNKPKECAELISEEIVTTHIKKFLAIEHNNIIDQYAEEFRQRDKNKQAIAAYNQQARKIVEPYYTENKASHIVNGKDLLAEVRRWAKEKYEVSITHNAIFSEIKSSEVDAEMKKVIADISS